MRMISSSFLAHKQIIEVANVSIRTLGENIHISRQADDLVWGRKTPNSIHCPVQSGRASNLTRLFFERESVVIHRKDIDIRVFLIPGGEKASLSAYEQLVQLFKAHEDVSLSVYRGPNKHDGQWSLVLIGEKTSFSRYWESIKHPLSEVQAQPIIVPPESLIPLVEDFLVSQVEMHLHNETFMERHYSPHKKRAAKGKATRRSRKGKKRH
jgi:hypothetical protein